MTVANKHAQRFYPRAEGLGGSCEGERGRGGWERTGDRVISPVTVAAAALSLLFHIGHFAVRWYLAVASDDASAGKCGEPEKPNETHSALRVNVYCLRLSNFRTQAVLAQPRASIHNYRPLHEKQLFNVLIFLSAPHFRFRELDISTAT